jgi:hypothetical protein
MRRTLAAVLFLSLVLAGCKAKEAYDKASISNDLDKRGTVDLMKQVADDRYTPPTDSKLTDAQVQMYLKVREREKAIAKVARDEAKQHADAAKKAGEKSLSGLMEGFKTLGSAAEMATADIRAAKDLHYNSQEYLWVKSQILAASGAEYTAKLAQAASASFDQAYAQAKKAYDDAKDDQTKAMYKQMLDGYDQSKNQMKSQQNVDPTVAYNRQLLSKYEGALNALTAELSKWEDKDGEAKKGMDDFQKSVDRAVQDAKAKP